MKTEVAGIDRDDDAAIVARIVGGEPRYYSQLVERHQRRLYFGCLRILGDRDESEDVVQETFVKAYERLADYDPDYRFYTWIYAMARNRCLNILRKRKVWSMLSLQDSERAPIIQAAEATDRRVEDRELATALSMCREALPDDQRDCFDLRHAEAFSYREIAATLDIPEGTVMSRLARARDKMRICLEAKGISWT